METSHGATVSPEGEKLSLAAVLLSPARVYRVLERRGALHRLLWGFFSASLLHGLMVGMTVPLGVRVVSGGLALCNALGMALLWTLVGWSALSVARWQRTPLAVVVPCVAYGFGVSLMVSWIPGSFWFAEPWKWGVIGTGFRELGAVTGLRAFGVVVWSLAFLLCFFKVVFMIQGA